MAEPQFVRMYDFQENLGKGHFAVVKRAQHVLSKEQVAVKIIDKLKLKPDELEHIHHEVRVMKLINHPNIIRLYQVVDTHKSLYLILELGNLGDLYEHIQKNGKMNESRAKSLFRQLVAAIVYCHSLHIVHRDLKTENAVFTDVDTIKITDFGLSNNFNPGEKMNTMCGSLAYSAPEMLLQEPYDGPSVDIWSLGIILYVMVVGHLPFQDVNESSTVFKILDVKYIVPDFITSGIKDLLAKMLLRDHDRRLSGEQVAAHFWLSNLEESLGASGFLKSMKAARASPPILSPEDHEAIIETMISNDMDRKTIIESLAANQYDHITSTYYLLAQKRRRSSTTAHTPLSTLSPEQSLSISPSTPTSRPHSPHLHHHHLTSNLLTNSGNFATGTFSSPRRPPPTTTATTTATKLNIEEHIALSPKQTRLSVDQSLTLQNAKSSENLGGGGSSVVGGGGGGVAVDEIVQPSPHKGSLRRKTTHFVPSFEIAPGEMDFECLALSPRMANPKQKKFELNLDSPADHHTKLQFSFPATSPDREFVSSSLSQASSYSQQQQQTMTRKTSVGILGTTPNLVASSFQDMPQMRKPRTSSPGLHKTQSLNRRPSAPTKKTRTVKRAGSDVEIIVAEGDEDELADSVEIDPELLQLYLDHRATHKNSPTCCIL